ncbi:MAG TPA: FixH family protein [Terracidiphilus sp.]|nr:FixH family protein [Terracidiphilus sp.]
MNKRNYQIALAATVAACIGLGSALGYLLLHHGRPASATVLESDSVVARGPAAEPPSAPSNAGGESAPLAPVQLSPQRLQEIGVTTATVAFKNVNDDLNVPGNVNIDEENLAYVQTRFPGWIQDVYANATYQYVRKGQPLFTIYSPDLVSSEQEYLLARQNQKAFVSDMHAGTSLSMAAQEGGWLLEAAEERIRQFGVPQQAIADLERTGKVQRNIAIDSPASGYITERRALPNAYVQPDTKLYTIADLSTVWVYADVFQDAVGRLRPGDPAQVTVDAYPGRTFYGRIDQILPQVDATTRTVRVRLIFRNPGVALKPGMYVNVNIHAPLGRQMIIPASAVLESGQQSIAFVDHGQGYLEPRIIQIGAQIDDSIVVLSGLKAGEHIVSSANFLVDSEAQLQAALGGFAPPPPPSPTTGKATPPEQIEIAFATEPDPPRKGTNTARVQLTGADGKPITATQVTVTFFMPAMPAMGMAAQRAVATLPEKGSGLYQGSLELPSGGTWQVTVTVQRGGQILATKQLSVDAPGGM